VKVEKAGVMGEIKLVDCTLRDGGYLNDWQFGYDNIINIYERLVSAGIDIIELGFLDERREYDADRTIFPGTEKLNLTYQGLSKGKSMLVGMIDYGTCGIERVASCSTCCLDGIRVIFKKAVMYAAIDYCKKIKALGYEVFVQAVSITSYDQRELQELIDLVNELHPYAFSLVDTYGLLHKKQLMKYFDFADRHLDAGIGLGYHSHNNFQLAYANCVELFENPPKRPLLIDGSLYGMGKSAGNAPLELLATYVNENIETRYHISQILEAIDVTILDIYQKIHWGYAFKFFLSALNDCHPNYVSYLMDKKKLSVKSINEILSELGGEKKLLYDKEYIEALYINYQRRDCEDSGARKALKKILADRKILLLAPGNSIKTEYEKIHAYMDSEAPIVIAINFLPEEYPVDYVFISNAKRYVQLSGQLGRTYKDMPVIATSNVTKVSGEFSFLLDYSRLLDEEALIVDNPMIMFLRLLNEFSVQEAALAGFDGYTRTVEPDYVNPNMEHSFSKEKALEINADVKESMKRLKLNYPYRYITASLYR